MALAEVDGKNSGDNEDDEGDDDAKGSEVQGAEEPDIDFAN